MSKFTYKGNQIVVDSENDAIINLERESPDKNYVSDTRIYLYNSRSNYKNGCDIEYIQWNHVINGNKGVWFLSSIEVWVDNISKKQRVNLEGLTFDEFLEDVGEVFDA